MGVIKVRSSSRAKAHTRRVKDRFQIHNQVHDLRALVNRAWDRNRLVVLKHGVRYDGGPKSASRHRQIVKRMNAIEALGRKIDRHWNS